MDKGAILETVHAERALLATDMSSVADSGWASTTMCSQWTVRDVLSHMTAGANLSGPSFLSSLVSSGFSFDKVQDRGIAKYKGNSPADTLAGFTAIINSNKRPPGPVQTILGETIIHGEDIRRSLGIAHTYPMDALIECASFFTKSNLIIGSRKRIAGLTLRATDTSWSTGSGPDVSGPILSIVLAMTGRQSALAECTGDGVEALRSRP